MGAGPPDRVESSASSSGNTGRTATTSTEHDAKRRSPRRSSIVLVPSADAHIAPSDASSRTAFPGSTTRSRGTRRNSSVSIERSRRSRPTSSSAPPGNTTTEMTSTNSPSSTGTSIGPNTSNAPSHRQTSAALITASREASDSNSEAVCTNRDHRPARFERMPTRGPAGAVWAPRMRLVTPRGVA